MRQIVYFRRVTIKLACGILWQNTGIVWLLYSPEICNLPRVTSRLISKLDREYFIIRWKCDAIWFIIKTLNEYCPVEPFLRFTNANMIRCQGPPTTLNGISNNNNDINHISSTIHSTITIVIQTHLQSFLLCRWSD